MYLKKHKIKLLLLLPYALYAQTHEKIGKVTVIESTGISKNLEVDLQNIQNAQANSF